MTIGVFFGSFNPIHLGHVTIVERFLQEDAMDEVWLSVSPHNPLKEKETLLATNLRVTMAKLATARLERVKVLDFEQEMPQPSYTYEALLELKKLFPKHRFILLIGGDNCELFKQWRNYDKILQEFSVWAYPRNKPSISFSLSTKIKITKASLLPFSSTSIRHALQERKNPEGLNAAVLSFIKNNHLYEK